MKTPWLLALILFVAGCGGGGGSGGNGPVNAGANPPVAQSEVGRFVDGPVAGLRYVTDSRSGVTSVTGEFEYLAGETVRFYVGELLLGEAVAQRELTPFDIVSDARPLTGSRLRSAIADNPWNEVDVTAQVRVINRAVLLQTLDADGNPDNGIEISAAVADLFAADAVNFATFLMEFVYDHGLNEALSRARSGGLLAIDRQPVHPADAASHLYRTLGISPGIAAAIQHSSDPDRDGVFDSGWRKTYDDRGRQIRLEFDQDLDGVPDQVNVNEYQEGLLIRSTSSIGDTHHSYDESGFLVRVETDRDGDGDADVVVTFDRDALGRPVEQRQDIDADGTVDAIHRHTYDMSGNAINRSSDSNGSVRTDEFTYDARGNQLERRTYEDGSLVRISSYAYDTNGRWISQETDTDADGSLDSSQYLVYDTEGRLVERRFVRDVEQINTGEYNAEGFLTRYSVDDDGDGAIDSSWSYEWDDDGNVVTQYADLDGDGSIDQSNSYEYDEGGNRTTTLTDSDGDGVPDRIESTQYGNVEGWYYYMIEEEVS